MTKENAHLFLPLIHALAEGKTIQSRWQGDCPWRDNREPQWLFGGSPENYRIKPEPEPPAMVPLEVGDVPPGSVFRYHNQLNGYHYIAITRVDESHLYLENYDLSYEEAMEQGEIKRPGEDWQPCSKAATEEVTNE